jgi:CMP-N-acetylneuraminic acid synthetase
MLGGRPLLDYGVLAAKASGCLDRIVLSTDDDTIEAHGRRLGIECDRRPDSLGTDTAKVADVALEWMGRAGAPDALVLIQPTSPFVTVQHIRASVAALTSRPDALTAQTIVQCPHNHHAWNQREFRDGAVVFRYDADRRRAADKQSKPTLWLFGNVVVARPAALEGPLGFFSPPSIGVPIERPYDFDVDGPLDLQFAEALLQAGLVTLAHAAHEPYTTDTDPMEEQS